MHGRCVVHQLEENLCEDAETRAKRIDKTVAKAEENIRANQWRP
jgi:hypothetical protein